MRGEKERLDRAHLHARFPGLVDGLAAHPGVGFVVVMDDDGPVALGNDGWHRLDDGHVEGEDPLAAVRALRARRSCSGPRTARRPRHLRQQPAWTPAPRRSRRSRAWSAATADSVAGRTGRASWSPRDLPFPEERVVGADAMHVALRAILRHCGHRTDVPNDGAATSPGHSRASRRSIEPTAPSASGERVSWRPSRFLLGSPQRVGISVCQSPQPVPATSRCRSEPSA